MSNAHIWRAAQERLRREMSSAQFETWLRGTTLETDGESGAVLNVRTTFAKELLESRYGERIQAAIGAVTGRAWLLRIAVTPALSAPCQHPVLATSARARTHASAHLAQPTDTRFVRPSLFTLGESATAAPTLEAAPAERCLLVGARPVVEPQPRATGGAARVLGTARHRIRTASKVGWSKGERIHAAIERARITPDVGGQVGREQRMRQATAEPSESRGRLERMSQVKTAAGRDRAAGVVPMPTGGYDDKRSPRAQRMEFSDASPADVSPAPTLYKEDQSENGGGMISIPAPRLNPRYTFATFIVGSANQLAHAASLAVADAPGQAYNPLFLYGGVGLGKTHLLHAIGHTALDRGLRVLYLSSETFTNEMINAIRFRTTEEFRAKYRSADLLLVDDIQFIAGKDSTEEEFFHTFNSLYEASKQIVMCSDRPPKAIVSLEERLRSRFEWGLIADIQPPELETRVAILRAKADMLQQRVPNDVITYLASAVQSNIRELEGSLNRLLAIAQLQGRPLTVETARSAISNLALDGKQKLVDTEEVLAAVAEYYRIPLADLQGKQRDKHIVGPRQVAMYLMRQETEASLLEIGQALGGRDHSTVMHGCEKIDRELNENTALRKEVLAIRQQLFG